MNVKRRLVYSDPEGNTITPESLVRQVSDRFLLNDEHAPDFEDVDLIVSSTALNHVVASGLAPHLELILALKEEMYAELLGLIYLGLKIKVTEEKNDLKGQLEEVPGDESTPMEKDERDNETHVQEPTNS